MLYISLFSNPIIEKPEMLEMILRDWVLNVFLGVVMLICAYGIYRWVRDAIRTKKQYQGKN